MTKKLILLALIAAAVAAFFYYDLGTYLSLDYLKSQQQSFIEAYNADPILIIGIFAAIYIVSTALSLPGASILTLLAGALFGVVTGTIVVSFASTIGATLAFLSSRFLLRDWVQGKFGDRLKGINDSLEKDGAFYLFTLRLIPAVPFFAVNLLMGLTKIKTLTYFFVSQLGMLAGTFVYVNAGKELAQIESLGDVASPGLLLSFLALALFPWIAKFFLGILKRNKAYKGYKKPKKFDRNLIAIGGGAGGLVSSYIAAAVKANVTLVEANEMGGDCLNTGCVPSKALIKSAKVANFVNHSDKYGIEKSAAKVNFPAVIKRVQDVIKTIEPHDSVERYTGLGVDVVKGYAKFIDPWTIEIAKNDGGTQRLTSKAFVLATGAAPFVPPLPGIEDTGYLTSDTLWDTMAKRKAAPKTLTILGGGPIGCELAQSFQRLGSQVTLVEMADRLLGKEDADAAQIIKASLEEDGVNVLVGHQALRAEGKKALMIKGPDGEIKLSHDDLLIAVGRRARLDGFGLENIGVDVDRGLVVDEYLATTMPHIYAAGDVAGNYQLTHSAAHEAWFAAVNALFGFARKFKADYRVLPRVTYTDPEVASVGLTEDDAKEQDIAYEVTTYGLDDLDRAIAESETKGFVKVLTTPGKDTILGATIAGSHAGELIAEFALAMRHKMSLGKIMATVHSYPTWSEANKFAAGQYRLERQPETVQKYAAKFFKWRLG